LYLLAVPADRGVAGPTLDPVIARRKLACAANGNRAGFSCLDSRGQWKGMDVDTCRAVAASGVGDADKVDCCAKWLARRHAARPQ
jgi:general L-amino acid transport system substrate-binding protein